jgi:hypothetical protein
MIQIGGPIPIRGWNYDGITHVNRNGPAFIASKHWPAWVFSQCRRERIETRLAELRAANEAATSWGAAVGARSEEIKDLERQLRRL